MHTENEFSQNDTVNLMRIELQDNQHMRIVNELCRKTIKNDKIHYLSFIERIWMWIQMHMHSFSTPPKPYSQTPRQWYGINKNFQEKIYIYCIINFAAWFRP